MLALSAKYLPLNGNLENGSFRICSLCNVRFGYKTGTYLQHMKKHHPGSILGFNHLVKFSQNDTISNESQRSTKPETSEESRKNMSDRILLESRRISVNAPEPLKTGRVYQN